MMASSMSTTTLKNETDENEEYGFRNQLLIGEIEDTAYEFFHKTFSKNPQLLQQELLNKTPQIKTLQKKKIIKNDQFHLLFPPNGNFPDSTKFDITLLVILIKNFCNVNKSSPDYANIVCILNARNESQHCSKKILTEKVFNKIYNKVEQSLLDLGASQEQLDYVKNVRIIDEKTKETIKRNQQSCVAFNHDNIPPVKNFLSRIVDIQNDPQMRMVSKAVVDFAFCGYLLHQHNISTRLMKLENYDEALRIYKEVENVTIETFGEKHKIYLIAKLKIGMCLEGMKNYDDALRIFKEVEETVWKKHELYREKQNIIGICLMGLQNYDDALRIYKEVEELTKETFGEKHKLYLLNKYIIGTCLMELQSYNDALRIFKEVEEVMKETVGEKHELYLINKNGIGGCLMKLKNYDDALSV